MALIDPHFVGRSATSLSLKLLAILIAVLVGVAIYFLISDDEQRKIKSHLEDCGLSRLGISGKSNLADQYDPKYRAAHEPGIDAQGEPTWRIKAMYMFPIKSCAPLELSRATIVPTGIEHDRHFTFVKWHTPTIKKVENGEKKELKIDAWEQINQRAYPKLSQVKAEVWVPSNTAHLSHHHVLSEEAKSQGCIVISFPHEGRLEMSTAGLVYLKRLIAAKLICKDVYAQPRTTFCLPLMPNTEQRERLRLPVDKLVIWKEYVDGIDMRNAFPPGVLQQLRKYLGVAQEMTLVRTDPTAYRPVLRNAPRKEQIGWQPVAAFVDSYPLHFTNMASIHDVASRLPADFGKLTALRFRSNFYITGPAAYDEDDWKSVTIGGHYLHVTNRATRCNLPNVNPDNGQVASSQSTVSAMPFKTLKAYRDIDPGGKGKPCFGMMMVPGSPESFEVNVGDDIALLTRGEHHKL